MIPAHNLRLYHCLASDWLSYHHFSFVIIPQETLLDSTRNSFLTSLCQPAADATRSGEWISAGSDQFIYGTQLPQSQSRICNLGRYRPEISRSFLHEIYDTAAGRVLFCILQQPTTATTTTVTIHCRILLDHLLLESSSCSRCS
jgi:hypothetical protein